MKNKKIVIAAGTGFILQAGFIFEYPQLQPAMENIIHRLPRRRYRLV